MAIKAINCIGTLRDAEHYVCLVVTMQAMDYPHCNGRAHKGMTEMADGCLERIWSVLEGFAERGGTPDQ
jgi:hypothetical protein